MNGIIRGKIAVLSFWNNGWLPFVCATDVSLDMTTDPIAIRTVKDGSWNKNTYKNKGFALSLGGTLMYDPVNWTGFDFADNWRDFSDIEFRLVLTDEQGDIKSFQGFAIIDSQSVSYTPGAIVKSSISLTGNGELKIFDGLIPCPAAITAINVAGQTGGSGTVTITYSYTGAPYQVKWRIDGMGSWIYTAIGTSIVVPGLSVGNHSIEIFATCLNGYGSDNSLSQAFIVTYGLTCSAVCVNINTGGGTINPTFTGSPTQWQYSIDGGPFITVPISTTIVSISGLGVGNHTVSVNPICSNGVVGTGILNQAFTVSSNPSQSIVNYTWISAAAGNILQIYVNGILNVSQILTASGSGSIIVAVGLPVKAVLQGINNPGFTDELKVQDSTLSTTLSDQFGTVPSVLNYTFTANGDTFLITAIVNP